MNDFPVAQIAYGKGRLPLRLDPNMADWHVIEPVHEEALANPKEAFLNACRAPNGGPTLRDAVRPGGSVVIVTSDGTRPVPNRQLIPWLLEELPVSPEDVTILLGTGTHRANTPAEIETMFGPELAGNVKIFNHDAYDGSGNEKLGTTASGAPVLCDKHYLEADARIVIGFIEPHFFAGFSGGAKGVFPGVAGIDSILHLHNYGLIADQHSVWGELDHNPIQREIAEMIGHCPPEFLVNVTLNAEKEIKAVFAGDYRAAHRAGCERSKAVAMVPVPHKFPIVVTSNSGFPLDQNLYQTVKGMSAAARIVEEGGTILVASECSDGIPDHGNFGTMLREADSPEAILQSIRALDKPKLDQWQAQILATIQQHADVLLLSTLEPAVVESAKLTPIEELGAALEGRLAAIGKGAPVAVLPEGPITIPYIG